MHRSLASLALASILLGLGLTGPLAACGGGGGGGPDSGGVDAGLPPDDAGGGMDAARPDAGDPVCVGTATDCSTLMVADCGSSMGCSVTQCVGFPAECSRRSQMQCEASATCTWDGVACTGTPAASCGGFASQSLCANEAGCTWVAVPVCRGTPVACSTLSREACESQPGCMIFVPPFDAGPGGFDAGCGTFDAGTGSVEVTVRVVLGPAPVTPAADVDVRIESACASFMEATTDASGSVSFTVDRGMGPWDITAAKAGYAAVSIVDVASIAVTGDIRLDPLERPMESPHPVSGTLGGTIGVGHSVTIDAYNFETIAMAGATWMSNYYSSSASLPQPLLFVALELDAEGRAVSFATTEVPREEMPITGVALNMPSPAVPPAETTVAVVLPESGMITAGDATPTRTLAFRLSDIDEPEFVITGTAQLAMTAEGATLTVQHFPDPAATNFAGGTLDSATARLNFYVNELPGPTLPDIVVGPGTLGIAGVDLGTLAAIQDGAAGHDVVAIHIGESMTDIPRWRVYAPTLPPATRVPHLPSGVSLADIGLGAGSTSVLALFMEMESGQVWSTRSANGGVPPYRYTIAGSYVTVSTAGR